MGRAAGLGAAAPASPHRHPGVQIGQRGVGLGVQNGVHVLGPADQTQQRHRLLGGHHQLHPRPFRGHQTGPVGWPPGPARAEDGVIFGLAHGPFQAEIWGA